MVIPLSTSRILVLSTLLLILSSCIKSEVKVGLKIPKKSPVITTNTNGGSQNNNNADEEDDVEEEATGFAAGSANTFIFKDAYEPLTAGFFGNIVTYCFTNPSLAVYCWGNEFNSLTAVEVSNLKTSPSHFSNKTVKQFNNINASNHNCVVASDNNAYCWGSGYEGRLGNGSLKADVPIAVSKAGVLSGKTVKEINSNSGGTCVIASDDKIYCWGDSVVSGVGDGSIHKLPAAVDASGVMNGKSFKKLYSSTSMFCGLSTEDYLYCWGNGTNLGDGVNLYGKTTPVAVDRTGFLSGLTIKQVEMHESTTCVIASDNNAYCWGINNYNLGSGSISSSTAWPIDVSGVLNGKTIKSISLAQAHGCVIASDNLGYCWGFNSSGQLGNNSTATSLTPVAVNMSGALNGLTLKSIKASKDNTCALASNDNLYCWGAGSVGQLGNGTYLASSVPVAVDRSGVLVSKTIKNYYLHENSVCVIASNDKAYCWGYPGAEGMLGINLEEYTNTPNAVSEAGGLSGKLIKNIEMNNGNTCFHTTSDKLYCSGTIFALPTGSKLSSKIPLPMYTNSSSEELITDIAKKYISPGGEICVLRSDNTYWCGENFNGLQKLFSFGSISIKDIYNYPNHSCATTTNNNDVYCWGFNFNGMLGNGTSDHSPKPVKIDMTGALAGKSVAKIYLEDYKTCALTTEGKLYCWGWNSWGELGNGTTTNAKVPVAVNMAGALNGLTIKDLAMTNYNICVIASNDLPYCWGLNGSGQVGNNSATSEFHNPTAVLSTGALNLKTVKGIYNIGYDTFCALASDDLLYCWGGNSNGKLGRGNTTNSLVPVAVSRAGVLSGKTFKKVKSTGGGFMCIIASDDRPYCWGDNSYGQLGNGNTTNATSPVAVTMTGALNGKTTTDVMLQNNTTCVLDNNSLPYCWGFGIYGYRGDGTENNSSVPVAVSF